MKIQVAPNTFQQNFLLYGKQKYPYAKKHFLQWRVVYFTKDHALVVLNLFQRIYRALGGYKETHRKTIWQSLQRKDPCPNKKHFRMKIKEIFLANCQPPAKNPPPMERKSDQDNSASQKELTAPLLTITTQPAIPAGDPFEKGLSAHLRNLDTKAGKQDPKEEKLNQKFTNWSADSPRENSPAGIAATQPTNITKPKEKDEVHEILQTLENGEYNDAFFSACLRCAELYLQKKISTEQWKNIYSSSSYCQFPLENLFDFVIPSLQQSNAAALLILLGCNYAFPKKLMVHVMTIVDHADEYTLQILLEYFLSPTSHSLSVNYEKIKKRIVSHSLNKGLIKKQLESYANLCTKESFEEWEIFSQLLFIGNELFCYDGIVERLFYYSKKLLSEGKKSNAFFLLFRLHEIQKRNEKKYVSILETIGNELTQLEPSSSSFRNVDLGKEIVRIISTGSTICTDIHHKHKEKDETKATIYQDWEIIFYYLVKFHLSEDTYRQKEIEDLVRLWGIWLITKESKNEELLKRLQQTFPEKEYRKSLAFVKIFLITRVDPSPSPMKAMKQDNWTAWGHSNSESFLEDLQNVLPEPKHQEDLKLVASHLESPLRENSKKNTDEPSTAED